MRTPDSRARLQTELDQLLILVEKLEVIVTPAARSGRIVAENGVATTHAQLEWALDTERQLIGDTDGGDRP